MSTDKPRENRFQNWILFGIFFVLIAGGLFWWAQREKDDSQKQADQVIEKSRQLKERLERLKP